MDVDPIRPEVRMAEEWLNTEYPDGGSSCGPFAFDSSDMIAAYLQGSTQAQADYVQHYSR